VHLICPLMNPLALLRSLAWVVPKWRDDVIWFYLDENASHPRSAHWILVLAYVFLCHSVYMLLRSVECPFTNAPSDYGHNVGSGWVADVKRYSGVPDGVSVLYAPLVSVDDDLSVMVNPRLSDVRRPVGHNGGKVRIGVCLNKFLYRLLKRFQFALKRRPHFVNIPRSKVSASNNRVIRSRTRTRSVRRRLRG